MKNPTGHIATTHGQSRRDRCIWMHAGVVKKKLCFRNYDCAGCPFDRALLKAALANAKLKKRGIAPPGKRGSIEYWKDKLRKRPVSNQPCIHYMKGSMTFKPCHHDYNCGNCEFDQYFDDQDTVYADLRPVSEFNIHGIRFPHGYYLHPGHTWVKLESAGEVRIGIDEFAMRVFGPFDAIISPLMGKRIEKNTPAIQIQRSTHQTSFLSPITGVVTGINAPLMEDGKTAEKDPYTTGWVLRAVPENLRHDLKDLFIEQDSGKYIEKDVSRLYGMIEQVAGPMATDGGHLGWDIFGHLPEIGWQQLVDTFLWGNLGR